jgi:hypothetical protein
MSQLYVDNIRNRTGGPIGIPTGAVVTGVVTATTGNITGNLTVGGNADITGVLTYEDVTNVDSVGVVTARSGIEFGASGVGGTITATGQAEFVGVVTARSGLRVVGGGLTVTGVSTFFNNVGINTDSPTENLSVNGNVVFGHDQLVGNPGSNIGVATVRGHHVNSNADYAELYFANSKSSGGSTASIRAGREGDNAGTNLTFYTQQSGGSAGNGSERLSINSLGEVKVGSAFSVSQAGVCTASSFSDSIGNLRRIPLKTESSSSSYTLIASDAGKTIHVHSTTTTVVVPNSVFSAGDAVSIVNGDGSNTPTISQGTGFSLRNTGDGTTGNRTLGVFGMATIYFTGAGVGYISGSGMT